MSAEDRQAITRTSLYDRAVEKVTEWVKPYLHRITQGFVAKSVDTYAKDNPRFARMIEFEVRRRGDGAGLTQDVGEPVVWTGVMTAVGSAIALLSKKLENKEFKWIGYGAAAAAFGAVCNNLFQLLRVVPRYKAGLQGSLEMAKDRWRSIEETGVDPFNNQQSPREINPPRSYATFIGRKAPVSTASLQPQEPQTPAR